MLTNPVFSFKDAIACGYNPREYQFNKDIPLGILEVRLDFKVWAKGSLLALTCFCTVLESGQLIRFNIFKNNDGDYILPNTNLNLRDVPYDSIFLIVVERTQRGNSKITGFIEV